MYTITIFNNITNTYGQVFEFETKRTANKWVKNNEDVRKCGDDYHAVNDFSIEYRLNY